MVSRAYNTQLQILMASNSTILTQFAGRLEPQEILVLAYDYQMIGNIDRAVSLYEVALEKAQDDYLRGEILRLKAQALFIPSPSQDLIGGRAAFREAAAHAENAHSLAGIGSRISALSDWGSAELLAGDWKCGQDRMTEALAALNANGGLLGDDGISMMQMLQMQLSKATKRIDQPAIGCLADDNTVDAAQAR